MTVYLYLFCILFSILVFIFLPSNIYAISNSQSLYKKNYIKASLSKSVSNNTIFFNSMCFSIGLLILFDLICMISKHKTNKQNTQSISHRSHKQSLFYIESLILILSRTKNKKQKKLIFSPLCFAQFIQLPLCLKSNKLERISIFYNYLFKSLGFE